VSLSARRRERIQIPSVRVRFFCEGTEAVGLLRNVSRAGLFVQTSEIPRAGGVVAIQFQPPVGDLVDLRGEVRWSTQGLAKPGLAPGFGVSIHEPPREYRDFFMWAFAQVKEEKDE
jgi:hypothetical protein